MDTHDIDSYIQKMTLEQKCALLSGGTPFATRAYPALGIPSINFSDGPHGVRRQEGSANHLGIGGSTPATCFPTAVSLGNTWDQALLEEVGEALGEEAAAQDVQVLLGPGICIKRSPLCGRNFEYISEDPLLAGRLAAGYIRGVQTTGVAACPKHFAANSQETRRQASDSIVDERTLREIYLTAFEIAVREGGAKTLMSSYNLVNGVYANESSELLDDILRKEWNFSGSVVSDWGGSNDHVAGVKAGSTFEMPSCGFDSVRELVRAVRTNKLDESVVDSRVREALELIFDTYEKTKNRAGAGFNKDGHHKLAKRAAEEGMVLLKNDNHLLPLSADKRVALIGDFAKAMRYQGAGSSLVNSTKIEDLKQNLQEVGLTCSGFAEGFKRFGGSSEELLQEAEELMQNSDVALVCLGLSEAAESEGLDREHINLDGGQIELLDRLNKLGKPIVAVVYAGSVVDSAWTELVDALLYAGLGGQAVAAATASVVSGKTNPSGKLAETWIHKLEENPSCGLCPSANKTAEYREGIYVGYRYYDSAGIDVAYPFGFGLSYTTFEYSDISVDEGASSVSFTITNTGDVFGKEIAQLYIHKDESEIFRAKHELKGFVKVALEPGESRRVSIALDEYCWRYFNVATKKYEIEAGGYELEIGASSQDIRLAAHVELAGTGAPNPYTELALPSYETAQVAKVEQAEFERLLGSKLPSEKIALDRNICFCDVNKGRSLVFMAIRSILKNAASKKDEHGRPNLNALFIYNMPMRALQKNAGEFIGLMAVDAIVGLITGWGWIAVLLALACFAILHNIGLAIAVAIVLYIGPLLLSLLINQITNRRFAALLDRQNQSQKH